MAEKKIDLSVGVLAGESPSKDLIDFLSALGVTPSLNKDFYRELSNFLSSGSGNIDFDDLTNRFFSALAGSGKSAQLDPLGLSPPTTNNDAVGSYAKPDETKKGDSFVETSVTKYEKSDEVLKGDFVVETSVTEYEKFGEVLKGDSYEKVDGTDYSKDKDNAGDNVSYPLTVGKAEEFEVPTSSYTETDDTKHAGKNLDLPEGIAAFGSSDLKYVSSSKTVNLIDETGYTKRKTITDAINEMNSNKAELASIDTSTSSSSENILVDDEEYTSKNLASSHPKRVITEISAKEITDDIIEPEIARYRDSLGGGTRSKRIGAIEPYVPSVEGDLLTYPRATNESAHITTKKPFNAEINNAILNMESQAPDKRNFEKNLNILMNSLLPYGAGSMVVDSLKTLYNNKGPLNPVEFQQVASLGLSAARDIQRLRYFSPTELGFLTLQAVTMLTLLWKRGITVKDMNLSRTMGVEFSLLTAKNAITEAVASSANVIDRLKSAIGEDSLNNQMGNAKDINAVSLQNGPLAGVTTGEHRFASIEREKWEDEIEPGENVPDGKKMGLERSDLDSWEQAVKNKKYDNGEWDIGEEVRIGDPGPQGGYTEQEIRDFVGGDAGEKIKAWPAPEGKEAPSLEEDPKDIHDKLGHDTWKDVFSYFNIVDGKALANSEILDLNKDYALLRSAGYNDIKVGDEKIQNTSNRGLSRTEAQRKIGEEEYNVVGYDRNITKDSYDNMIRRLSEKSEYQKVGAIYVWPIVGNNSSIEPKWIPFQFNPIISEAAVSARYQSTQVLSRIGNLQSYLGTDSLTLTMEVKYFPTSNKNTDTVEYVEPGWLSAFDMPTVQLIEMGYRALKLPIIDGTSGTAGYKYYKPPLVKIVMGDWRKGKIAYHSEEPGDEAVSNLLSYPYTVVEDHFEGDPHDPKGLRKFKTFIVTSVNVIKDFENSPYYIDKDGNVRDVMGYTVNLTMTEVSRSYANTVPNFKDYYDFVIGRL